MRMRNAWLEMEGGHREGERSRDGGWWCTLGVVLCFFSRLYVCIYTAIVGNPFQSGTRLVD